MSTTTQNQEAKREVGREEEAENDAAPPEITNDGDDIEYNFTPQKTTIMVERGSKRRESVDDEDMIEKNPTPKKTNAKRRHDDKLPESIPVVDSQAAITISELEDDDVELWLVTVPRHESVRATLPGSKLGFPDSDTTEEEKEEDKKKVGVLRGSYVYREKNAPEKGRMRAAFVIQGEDGKPKLQIAKPFARTINVVFDADMDLEDHDAPIKTYPKMPPGLELQYLSTGSKKRRIE